MNNKNKIQPGFYLFLTVLSSLTMMFLYCRGLFLCYPLKTYNESKVILWVIWGVSLVVTYLLTFRKHRNYFSIIANSVLPFGIYSTITYADTHNHLVTALKIAIIIISGLLGIACIVFFDISDDRDKLHKNLKRLVLWYLNCAKSIASVCLMVLLVYISVLNIFNVPSVIPATKSSESITQNKEAYLNKRLSEISDIDESVWKDLSKKKRLAALQALADVDAVQQGINHEIKVRSKYIGSTTMGTYEHSKHLVTINTMLIEDDDPTEAVSTLLHEVRHSLQHTASDAYLMLAEDYKQLSIFDEIRSVYENLDNYKSISKGDSYSEYKNQIVEADSRDYSDMKTEFYFQQAKEYLSKQ